MISTPPPLQWTYTPHPQATVRSVTVCHTCEATLGEVDRNSFALPSLDHEGHRVVATAYDADGDVTFACWVDVRPHPHASGAMEIRTQWRA